MKYLVVAAFLASTAAFAADSGLLIKQGDNRSPAPIVKTDVRIKVTGVIARVEVAQSFFNPGDEWAEGIYVFPLPENAAVDHLKMRVADREIEGVIRERERAQRIYEAAKSEGRKTSLVSQERPNIFTTSVANIPPKAAVDVAIEYQQTLRLDSGQFSLRFPMVVGPRYIPGTDAVTGVPGTGWAQNTSEVGDASRITPPVVKGGINPVSIEVMLNSGFPLARIESNYHELNQLERGEYQYRARIDNTPADRDFELTWVPEPGKEATAALLAESRGDSRYALLMLMPPAQPLEHASPREVIFVIDTSGSMHGASLAQAKDALKLAVSRLKGTGAFNVIEFNSITRQLFAEPRRADRDSIAQAIRYIERLEANGGTEMLPALRTAFGQEHDRARVRQIVFLTDGAVGNEDQLFELIRLRLGESRLFMIGIGSAPNTYFMKKAAEFGRGTFTYIGKIEEVHAKMSALFAKLERPALTAIDIAWPGETEMWPQRIPDLYFGEPLVVAAKLPDTDGAVSVQGSSGGIQWRNELPLAAASSGFGIHALWAREKIEALANTERENPDAIRRGIVELALEHHLVSKHTSLVAVDLAPARPKDAELRSSAVPTNLPSGWSCVHVFGHECADGELPQGATGSERNIAVGLVLLALAMLLEIRRRRTGFARMASCTRL